MKNNKIIVFILFAIIAFAIYYNSLNSSFHFDDFSNITQNPKITISDLSLSALNKAALGEKNKLRSVSYLSFALNYYFSGEKTNSYHVINVMIHIINAFLIYFNHIKAFFTHPLAPSLRHACHGRGTW